MPDRSRRHRGTHQVRSINSRAGTTDALMPETPVLVPPVGPRKLGLKAEVVDDGSGCSEARRQTRGLGNLLQADYRD